MLSKVKVQCTNEGCGFRGVASTGWIQCKPALGAKMQAEGFQTSDDGTRVRLRVRQLACPRCHHRSLTREDGRVADVVSQLSRALVSPVA